MQTYFDVEHFDKTIGKWWGKFNMTPLRRDAAEKLLMEKQKQGQTVRIVPTADALWEKTYGDK